MGKGSGVFLAGGIKYKLDIFYVLFLFEMSFVVVNWFCRVNGYLIY